MFNYKRSIVGAALLLCALGASASTFRAADTIYLPAAGRLAGGNNSFFRTDLFISNLTNDRVTVEVAYAPTGDTINNAPTTNPAVTQKLTLAPGQRREIVDVMKTTFNLDTAFGHLVFFACREGGNCADTSVSTSDLRNISVEARIYTTAADGSTFGQTIPGLPWYTYVAGDTIDPNLQRVFITGLRNNADFRTNLGLVNYSTNSTINIRVRIFNADGQPVNETTRTLAPLAHTQFALGSLFSGTGFYLTLEEAGFTANPSTTPANEVAHGFFAYGSLLDNKSNDPTYLETQFLGALNSDCVFGAKPPKRIRRAK